jgi:hypothetical protein
MTEHEHDGYLSLAFVVHNASVQLQMLYREGTLSISSSQNWTLTCNGIRF